MRDNNILTRHIKPAARELGLDFVNWRCLRTSYGTWLKRHGADMKDIQGQMRHSRMSTTADIYVQDIPESRRSAVERLPLPTSAVSELERFGTERIPDSLQLIDSMVARDGVEPPTPAFSGL